RIYQFVGWAKGLTRAHRQPESWMGTDAFAHPTQVFYLSEISLVDRRVTIIA
ncbi:MAG: hypothetical protein HC865_25875, partial [Cyanobacteria bacterium RU_5_0]|nr:hypothetical protein [Cyanobacteria bacterium RU_5_0]